MFQNCPSIATASCVFLRKRWLNHRFPKIRPGQISPAVFIIHRAMLFENRFFRHALRLSRTIFFTAPITSNNTLRSKSVQSSSSSETSLWYSRAFFPRFPDKRLQTCLFSSCFNLAYILGGQTGFLPKECLGNVSLFSYFSHPFPNQNVIYGHKNLLKKILLIFYL